MTNSLRHLSFTQQNVFIETTSRAFTSKNYNPTSLPVSKNSKNKPSQRRVEKSTVFDQLVGVHLEYIRACRWTHTRTNNNSKKTKQNKTKQNKTKQKQNKQTDL